MTIDLTKIFDISMPIETGMPVYKGKPEKQPVFTIASDFVSGTSHETQLCMNLHTGTHADAPLHMIPDGLTSSSFSPGDFLGPCRVIDCTEAKECITRELLADMQITSQDFILLKTRNSCENILESTFVYLEKSGAEYLAACRIRGIGIDSLGIERSQPGHETHLLLMKNGIIIIEGLRLADVPAGSYFLCALPLSIPGADAAPLRAVLLPMVQ